jgi:hypothetical protein
VVEQLQKTMAMLLLSSRRSYRAEALLKSLPSFFQVEPPLDCINAVSRRIQQPTPTPTTTNNKLGGASNNQFRHCFSWPLALLLSLSLSLSLSVGLSVSVC